MPISAAAWPSPDSDGCGVLLVGYGRELSKRLRPMTPGVARKHRHAESKIEKARPVARYSGRCMRPKSQPMPSAMAPRLRCLRCRLRYRGPGRKRPGRRPTPRRQRCQPASWRRQRRGQNRSVGACSVPWWGSSRRASLPNGSDRAWFRRVGRDLRERRRRGRLPNPAFPDHACRHDNAAFPSPFEGRQANFPHRRRTAVGPRPIAGAKRCAKPVSARPIWPASRGCPCAD
jgi:hypothetical protein